MAGNVGLVPGSGQGLTACLFAVVMKWSLRYNHLGLPCFMAWSFGL